MSRLGREWERREEQRQQLLKQKVSNNVQNWLVFVWVNSVPQSQCLCG